MSVLRNPENATLICQRIAEGFTLRQIAREVGVQSASSITDWVRDDESFAAQYARAKELQADRMAEEIVEISDNGANDWMEREFAEGAIATVADHEHIARSKLRVDSRKWLMSKMLPKKYGDKLTMSGDPENPLIPESADPGKIALAVLSVLNGAKAAPAPSRGATRAETEDDGAD